MGNVYSNGFNIDAFKSNFKNGARNYLFYVYLKFPEIINVNDTQVMYLVRGSSVPGKTVEAISVPWQGYEYKVGGKSSVEDWTVSFTVDLNADVYKQFISWSNLVHDTKTNIHGLPDQYMKDQRVQMLSLDGKSSILESKLIGAWPTSVSTLELSYDSSEIATFDVSFSYVRHEYEDVYYPS